MAITMRPSHISDSCPLLTLLRSSPWPLSIADIASVLEVDEKTAALALRALRDAGKARLEGCLWLVTPAS
jgi:hypothetical protein